MKNLFLILILSILPIFGYTQQIVVDKVTDGVRYILGSAESVRSFTDKHPISVSLSAMESPTFGTKFSLVLTITSNKEFSIPENGKLLIKLKDGSTIQLTTLLGHEDRIGEYNTVAKTRIYTVIPSYDLTLEQIEQISGGVSKLRVETKLDSFDKDFKKDKIGDIIAKEYALISNALKIENDFGADF